MKRSLILLCAVLIAAAAPLVPARAQSGGDALPIEFVYDALGPYGDWIYTPNYGYVWQPVGVGPDWREIAGEIAGEPGSGLGLSLVAAVAAAHGGRLELDEGPGVVDGKGPGLRVALVFPAA